MFDLQKMASTERSIEEVAPQGGGDIQQRILDDIALMIGRQLTVYTAVYQSALAEELDMPIADLKALNLIMEFDSLPTGQLSHLMGISSGGTTALIDRLETAGYVRRDRHPPDRRIVIVRPILEKCEPLRRERQAIANEVTVLSRDYDASQMELVHNFVSQCVGAFRHDTLTWLQSRHPKDMDD